MTALPPPIICNYRIDFVDNPLFPEQQNLLQAFKSGGNPNDPYRRLDNQGLLYPDEIVRLQKRKLPVTLFVHGYNVPYGHFGKQIIKRDGAGVTFGDEPATTLREGDEWLNGSGAHNWWLHMASNLNIAMGAPSEFYRPIHIAWQANPASLADYMVVETVAMATAPLVAKLVTQLSEAGLTVNAIGHSAGCDLLIKTMALLPPKQLTQVFLWQAAVPDDALTPVAEAAAKTTVLFSRNDQVLGPGADNQLINLVDHVDTANKLQSVYHMAHLFRLPLDALLFSSDARKKLYKMLTQRNKQLPQQLAEFVFQCNQLPVSDRARHYNELAALIGILIALVQQTTVRFLKDKKSRKHLKFLHHHPDEQLDALLLRSQNFFQFPPEINQRLLARVVELLLLVGEDNACLFCDTRTELAIELAEWLEQKLSPTLNDRMNKPNAPVMAAAAGEEVAALVLLIMSLPDITPRPALGYSGPASGEADPLMQTLIDKGKVVLVDQTPWLFSHSAMKVPTKAVMDYSYRAVIAPALLINNNS